LPTPARPDEREQATLRVLQQPVDRFELRRTTDERRSRPRKVLHTGLDRLQQRKLARQTLNLELVDALRRAQILEPVHPQVANIHVHERMRRLREQHLAAVADRRDAGALVHVQTDIAGLGQPRLSRVQPHPNPYRPIGQRPLALGSSGDSVRRTGEGDEECVTLRVDLDTLVLRKRNPEPPPMLLQRLPVVVAELV
jgi:hypothetical protein